MKREPGCNCPDGCPFLWRTYEPQIIWGNRARARPDDEEPRYLQKKICDRCHELKDAEDFPNVRGGGTAGICSECKRSAVSDAMILTRRRG